jgi:hypothetical protein
MFTYIKHDVPGFYIELAEQLSEELYDNLGTTWDDFIANKFVLLSDEQVAFHNENPSAKVSEVWTMVLDPVHERDLNDAKNEMKSKIEQYDKSEEVNGFTINNAITAWFTVEERLNYQRSVEAALSVSEDSKLTFFVGDNELSVSAKLASAMLSQIQLYADECFIVTKRHMIAMNALETIEEVDAYDYKSGYPAKLNFDLA